VLHILICKAYHTFQLKTGHQRFVLSQMEIGVQEEEEEEEWNHWSGKTAE
jgi:hypothetical protein